MAPAEQDQPHTTPTDPAATDPTAEQKAEDAKEATKRKFREALEAKHGRQGEAHIDADPPSPDAHGPVNEKRTFRRKTG